MNSFPSLGIYTNDQNRKGSQCNLYKLLKKVWIQSTIFKVAKAPSIFEE